MYFSTDLWEADTLEGLAKIIGKDYAQKECASEPTIPYIYLHNDAYEIELPESEIYKLEKEALEWAAYYHQAAKDQNNYDKQCRGF